MKISTPATPKGATGSPFGQPVVIVFTANVAVRNAIYQQAIDSGCLEESLNTLVVPEEIVRLGPDQNSDTFSILNRMSSPADQEALDEYLNHISTYVQVYRVTANNAENIFFPVPYLTPRGTGYTELGGIKYVDELRKKILERYIDKYQPVDIRTEIWVDESYLTIQQNINNILESRDSPYFATDSFKLPEGAFFVVYGFNHTVSGKATYANMVIYGNKIDNGVCSVDNSTYVGSASAYIEDNTIADSLYAWIFAYEEQSCWGNDFFTIIPHVGGVFPPDTSEREKFPPYTVIPEEDIYVGFRAYLEPATKVGPVWHELILDRVILFIPIADRY